jgi:hypothetical protein
VRPPQFCVSGRGSRPSARRRRGEGRSSSPTCCGRRITCTGAFCGSFSHSLSGGRGTPALGVPSLAGEAPVGSGRGRGHARGHAFEVGSVRPGLCAGFAHRSTMRARGARAVAQTVAARARAALPFTRESWSAYSQRHSERCWSRLAPRARRRRSAVGSCLARRPTSNPHAEGTAPRCNRSHASSGRWAAPLVPDIPVSVPVADAVIPVCLLLDPFVLVK